MTDEPTLHQRSTHTRHVLDVAGAPDYRDPITARTVRPDTLHVAYTHTPDQGWFLHTVSLHGRRVRTDGTLSPTQRVDVALVTYFSTGRAGPGQKSVPAWAQQWADEHLPGGSDE